MQTPSCTKIQTTFLVILLLPLCNTIRTRNLHDSNVALIPLPPPTITLPTPVLPLLAYRDLADLDGLDDLPCAVARAARDGVGPEAVACLANCCAVYLCVVAGCASGVFAQYRGWGHGGLCQGRSFWSWVWTWDDFCDGGFGFVSHLDEVRFGRNGRGTVYD